MSHRVDEIQQLLAPAVDALGLELLGIDWVAAPGSSLLRLYIDVAGRPVTVEDCEAVSREVEALLDVNDPITGHYTLEVSSPGIDRPLFNAAQFGRHVGETARLVLKLARDGRRKFEGEILGAEGSSIQLRIDGLEQPLVLEQDDIEKARIVPDLVALGLAPAPKPGGRRAAKKQ